MKIKNYLDKLIEELRMHSRDIEFARAKRHPSFNMQIFLWITIMLNLVVAALFAVTIVGIPLSVMILIGCMYVYQVYLRR